jgi:hypothetical protein
MTKTGHSRRTENGGVDASKRQEKKTGQEEDKKAETNENSSCNLKVIDLADKIFIVGHPKVCTKQDKRGDGGKKLKT